MTVENKWCLTTDGNEWTATISSQMECQDKCLTTPFCIGISYSYSEGMANSCFLCKALPLAESSYGFSFYRMPGKLWYYQLQNMNLNKLISKSCNCYILSLTYYGCRLLYRCRLYWTFGYLRIKLLSLWIESKMLGKWRQLLENRHLRKWYMQMWRK